MLRLTWGPETSLDDALLASAIRRRARCSAPDELLASSSSVGDSLNSTSIQFVTVLDQRDHCTFVFHVTTPSEQFVVTKRFSEIRAFRASVLNKLVHKDHCGAGACHHLTDLKAVKFPRRRVVVRKESKIDLAQRRSASLESFLLRVLQVYKAASRRERRCCVNRNCAVLRELTAFLELDAPLLPPMDGTLSAAVEDPARLEPWDDGIAMLDAPVTLLSKVPKRSINRSSSTPLR